MLSDPKSFIHYLDNLELVSQIGHVTDVVGIVIESLGPSVSIGEMCTIVSRRNGRSGQATPCEVVGFRGKKVLLMPFGHMQGISPGDEVHTAGRPVSVNVSDQIVGRVLDGLGNPIDGRGPVLNATPASIYADPPRPLDRARIREPLPLGVRAIDALLTCGKGQRLGIFSGSGIGKSSVMGMISRFTRADLSVIALVGERGREVKEFIERDLGPDGLERSVVVVATSDQPPLVRQKAAFVATAIAEHFRDKGMDVLLMVDSITRFAFAQREIGLATGEPPTTRGYTPSLFSMLPKLLERTGQAARGSITGLYNVLVEADDMNEPVADAVRSILDGHVVLSRKMAQRNVYPAVDVLQSISRVMGDVASNEHVQNARRFRERLSIYSDAEDLINIGAYVRGSNKKIDSAIDRMDDSMAFISQGLFEKAEYDESVARLKSMTTV